MGTLYGFWIRPQFVERNVLTIERRLLLYPQYLQCVDPFAGLSPAIFEANSVMAHLADVPTGTHAKNEAAVRQTIQCRNLLCERDWMMLIDQTDARSEFDPARYRRRGCQTDEGVGHVPVFDR